MRNGAPYVEIERLAKGFLYGPCLLAEGTWTPGMTTSTQQTTGPGNLTDAPHQHTLTADVKPLGKGDRVLVAFVEGRDDDVVVLARVSA